MKIALLFAFCLLPFFSYSQPEITFEKTFFDYDTIPYGSENGECTFKFTNTGNEPLKIMNCQTAGGGLVCGKWPKEPIQPQGKGIISFAYYTGNAGRFHKSATITTNAKNTISVLFVKGYVLPVPILYVKKNFHDFGVVDAGTPLTYKFEISNEGIIPLVISKIESIDNCMAKYPDTIFKSGFMEVCIDMKDKPGQFKKEWIVYTNASSKPTIFTVTGDVKFSPLRVDTTAMDFKDLTSSKVFKFECTNTSNDTIEIYDASVENSSNDIWIPTERYYRQIGNKILLPYETAKLTLVYEPTRIIEQSTGNNNVVEVNIYSRKKGSKLEYINVIPIVPK